jgi:peptidyl-prolyl cis-trans isomerase C
MASSLQSALLVALVLAVAGCPRKPAAPRGQPLALLGDEVLVTSAELEAELRNRSPTLPSGQIDAAAARDLLHKLIQFELLYRESAREGLEKDDEVGRQLKKAMLNQFVQHKLDQDPRAVPDTDAELMVFYEKHKDDYAKPERLRLLLIELKPQANPALAPPEAAKALAELRSRGNSAAAFSALARQISADERTQSKGGETDWTAREDLVAHYGEPVLAAAENLQPNQTAGPVRGKDGWFLVQFVSRQPATNPTFDQLKPILKARAYHDKRADIATAYENDLRKRSDVRIDEEVLAKIDFVNVGDEKSPLAGAPAK